MLLPLHPARGVRPQTFLYFFAWLLSHFFIPLARPPAYFLRSVVSSIHVSVVAMEFVVVAWSLAAAVVACS